MTMRFGDWEKARDRAAKEELFAAQCGRSLSSRQKFIADLKTAVANATPFAAARIGNSEQHWMYYPVLLSENPHPTKRRVFEKYLRFYGLSQAGIFPEDNDFYLRYNQFYLEHVRNLDWLGLILDPVMDPAIVRFYQLQNTLLYFKDLIPDRSIPDVAENCYLPSFAGKKLLLVSPFADLLKARANRETFEAVWSNTGKKWFHPAAVDALEFPYGYDKETQSKYSSAIALFDHITGEMAKKDFDIALVAAAGLAIPLVSAARQMGKISVSFGSELQLLFGVLGARWRAREGWMKKYFNDAWIDMPTRYRPQQKNVSNAGAYW